MAQPIHQISLPLPFGMGAVNCYLIQAGDGYVLIDTGAPNGRDPLVQELSRLGCLPGALKLILITHGDFDHIGNAAHLRRLFGCQIAMQAEESFMAETGDMFANRGKSNALIKALLPRLIGFGKSERFTPDVLIKDDTNLSAYGLEATTVLIPGHSKGSIGLLTASGDFFCGDLLENTKQPALGSIIDDRAVMLQSLAKLLSLAIHTVYPGHGQPFPISTLTAPTP